VRANFHPSDGAPVFVGAWVSTHDFLTVLTRVVYRLRMPAWRVMIALFILLIFALVVSVSIWRARYALDLPSPGRDPGKAAATRYVFEYIAALNANDSGLLGEVVGRSANAPDIQETLRLFGGRDLIDVEVTVVHDFRYHYQVWITARTGDGSIVEMYQIVGWTGEHFRILQLHTGPIPPR